MKTQIKPIQVGHKEATQINFVWASNQVGSETYKVIAEMLDKDNNIIYILEDEAIAEDYKLASDKELFLLDLFKFEKQEVEQVEP